MPRPKSVPSVSPGRLKLLASLGEATSLDDVVVTIIREDKMLGKVRMNWHQSPWQADFEVDEDLAELMDIFAQLAERGHHLRMEQDLAGKSDERPER